MDVLLLATILLLVFLVFVFGESTNYEKGMVVCLAIVVLGIFYINPPGTSIFPDISKVEADIVVFKQIDRGEKSFYMELLMTQPTKKKIETEIRSLTKKYKGRRSLQIDIFDDLEALQRRGDEKYPSKLVYKYWLVSITDKEIRRFYLKERPDIR